MSAQPHQSHQSKHKKILLDIFSQLPTDYLLCAVRLSCPEWKTVLESSEAQLQIWGPRAQYFETKAQQISREAVLVPVHFVPHQAVEAQHATTLSNIDRCLHYYSYVALWLAEKGICGDWVAHYYTSSGEMHKYWLQKDIIAQEKQAAPFSETDTAVAISTIASSREAAQRIALQHTKNLPFTAPL